MRKFWHRRNNQNKRFTLHEPEVQSISKRKKHKKYEFGNKVSIIRSEFGLILGAKSFRNEYEGHIVKESLNLVKKLTGKDILRLAGDRGYREKREIDGTEIVIPSVHKSSDSTYQKKQEHKLSRKRAGIEPITGHLKSDFRLRRNFYKGALGDSVNVILAAAAYNFKRAMRAILLLIQKKLEKS